MKGKIIIFMILLINSNINYSQDKGLKNMGINNIVGKTYILQSQALKESREIKIYLPQGYDKSDKKYPVLYILDGQKFFLYGVNLQQLFNFRKYTPDFIVVGITNTYPQRFSHFNSGAAKFINFIEKDVLSYVDKNFRTSQTRILFGWEYAGALVVQLMTDVPQLFDAYIAASPFPIKENRLKRLSNRLLETPDFNRFFYFSVAQDEGMVNDGANDLNTMLLEKSPNTMDWFYKILVDEEHTSTPFSTLYQGIKKYYATYPELQFKNLEKYYQAGGMKYVEDYHKQRAQKFGFSIELSNWTKFTLIRNAIRADDFDQFEIFMKTFKSESFITGLRGTRPYGIAEYYEKHKKFNNAIDIYTLLMNKNPELAQPLKSLGDVYTLLKDKNKADEYYEKIEKTNVK